MFNKAAIKYSAIIILLIGFIPAMADEDERKKETKVGFIIGLSTPNDKINDVYNSGTISLEDGFGKLRRLGINTGYHLALRFRFVMGDNADFIAGLGFHRFPQSNIEVIDPENGKLLLTLKTHTNILPLTAGLNYYLFQSFFSLYGTAGLTYNYVWHSVDYQKEDIGIPLTSSPSSNWLGICFGGGLDLDLGFTTANLEIKYNYLNFIGPDQGASPKTYLTAGLGLFF